MAERRVAKMVGKKEHRKADWKDEKRVAKKGERMAA